MKRALLLLSVVSACLLVGEGVLSALGFGHDLVYEFDERLFWKLEADQDAYAPSYRVGYRIGSRGWRGPDAPRDAAAAGRRVLGLGDSVLFGQGVAWADTLAGRLDARPDLHFVNTAVPGYSLYHYRQVLAQEGLEPAPDRVLLAFVKNDVVSSDDIAELEERARVGLMEHGSFADRRLRARSAWLHLGSGAWSRLKLLWSPPPRALAYTPPAPSAGAWRYSLGLLDEIAVAAERAGVPLAFVAFPTRAETETGRVAVALHAVRALATRRGFRVVDLQEPFVAHRDEGLFLDPVHPSARGNTVAADVVLEELAEWL